MACKLLIESHLKLRSQTTCQGGALVTTIVISALVGLMLSAYLSMVSTQITFTQRSQIWNNCIPLCEGGVEEALAHLNHQHTVSNFAINGWVEERGIFHKNRLFDQGECLMRIDGSYPPIITVVGKIPGPLGNGTVARTVRVRTRLNQRFPTAILARGTINMGGGARLDSFNSTNDLESTNGRYDPAEATDHAMIATVSRTPGDLNLGNADIYGSVATGPGGTVTVGPNGNVGSEAYNNNPANNGTVEAGHYKDNANMQIPDGELPDPFGPTLSPQPGIVDSVSYTYVLESADYRINAIELRAKQNILVKGKARIYVLGATSVSGQARIIIAPGGSLELYAGRAVDLAGGGVMNNGYAKDFSIIGLNTCTGVKYAGNSEFTGTIYAPHADVTMIGTSDAYGAFVGKSFMIGGTMDLHYDEALRGETHRGRFLADSWEETKFDPSWEEL